PVDHKRPDLTNRAFLFLNGGHFLSANCQLPLFFSLIYYHVLMSQTRLPTQFDVAKLSKVSRSTVAAILRSDPDNCPFNPETRKRVMDAVRELNYQPNSSARMLRNRRTNSIAIVVPHLDTIRGTIQVQNMLGVGRRARELDYTIH